MDFFKLVILLFLAGICVGRHIPGRKPAASAKAEVKPESRSGFYQMTSHDTHIIHHDPVFHPDDQDNEGIDVKAYRTPHGIDLHIMVQDVVDDHAHPYGYDNTYSDYHSNGEILHSKKSQKATETKLQTRSKLHPLRKAKTKDKQAYKKQYAPIAPGTVSMTTGDLADEHEGHGRLVNDEGFLVHHEGDHVEHHARYVHHEDGDEQAEVQAYNTPHGLELHLNAEDDALVPDDHHVEGGHGHHVDLQHGAFPVLPAGELVSHGPAEGHPVDLDSVFHEPIGHPEPIVHDEPFFRPEPIGHPEEEYAHHPDEYVHEHVHHEEVVVPQHDDMHIVVEQPVPPPPVINQTKIEPEVTKVEFLPEGVGTDTGGAKTKENAEGDAFVGKTKQTNVNVVPAASTSSLVQSSNTIESQSSVEQGAKKAKIKRRRKDHHKSK